MTLRYRPSRAFEVVRDVNTDEVSVADRLTVFDCHDQVLAIQVKTEHGIRVGSVAPTLTSETWGEVNLTHDETIRLRDYLTEVIAHRAAHEAGLPAYRAALLPEEAAGDHRIGIFELFEAGTAGEYTDGYRVLRTIVCADRRLDSIGRALTEAGYRIVGPDLGSHLIDLGHIANVKEVQP